MARHPSEYESIRVRLVLAAMLAALSLLTLMLWQIQVARGQRYEKDLEKQSIRRVRLPGMRGRIFDRNQKALADNRPSFCIALYLEELRQPGTWDATIDHVQRLINEMSAILGMPPQVEREDIQIHIRKRLPLPLLAWRDIDEKALARWAEMGSTLPGIDIYTEAVRIYPNDATACHLLGYVGRADLSKKEEEPFHYYLPQMEGKAGVEGRYDPLLRGQFGGQLVRVDVTGYRRRDPSLEHLTRLPKAGHDVLLALDLRVQEAAERALGEEAGSVVVLDPRNGDLLAMASFPKFDLNEFVPSISDSVWSGLLNDPGKPMFNRAAAGAYAPGSTFKPVVALAALENKLASGATSFSCPGSFQLGNITFNCAHNRSHGKLNMRQALAYSCNVYFYKLGLKCGYDYIYHMASALGLGRKTGLTLDYEAPGLLPNSHWMRDQYGHGWRAGDTVNASIGQGAMNVTPLQMAVLTAAIANGGTVYQPRVVLGTRAPGEEAFGVGSPVVLNQMHWSAKNLALVRGGMRDVIMADHGTGRRAAVPGVTMAGKTGTAEYGKKSEKKYRGWMIAFAPFERPRYAVAMVIDDAISGGTTVGPRIQQFMSELLGATSPVEVRG